MHLMAFDHLCNSHKSYFLEYILGRYSAALTFPPPKRDSSCILGNNYQSKSVVVDSLFIAAPIVSAVSVFCLFI